jgi:hypothetical protein
VAHGRVDRLGVARGRSIAAAVVGRAQVRAAFDHLAWNPDLRLAGVVALVFPTAARVCRIRTLPARVLGMTALLVHNRLWGPHD